MANATISLIKGGVTYTFVIEGLLRLGDRKSQVSAPLPIPTLSDEYAVLANITGQTRIFSGSFLLLERSDDYTNGTGSPGSAPYSIDAQKTYLMDTIFQPTGKHRVTDELGNSFDGRITEIEYVKQGDDPNSDSVVFSFTRGTVF